MPVKPLTFKGDKKSSSRKRKHAEDPSTTSLVPSAASKFNITNPTTTTTTTTTTNPHIPSSEDDSWTTPNSPSDLTGPTLLILPTTPPTCLASDANGNIFASLLENILDSDPRTAEPHDVRQVWVASKIAGMGDGEVGFRGAHGGWLACDRYGILGARREARGMEEGFGVEIVVVGAGEGDNSHGQGVGRTRGMWRVRTAASKEGGEKRYLCAVVEGAKKHSDGVRNEGSDDEESKPPPSQKRIAISLRGDGTVSSTTPSSSQEPDHDDDDNNNDTTLLHIKMQTRFLHRSATQQAASARHEKVSRRELEVAVGRKLDEEEVRRLKRKKRAGDGFMEEVLDLRSKGKHDKFA